MKKFLCISLAALLLMTCAIGLAIDVYVEDIPAQYSLTLDGIPIQLPVPLSVLLDKGWTINPYSADSVLPSMTYDTTSLYKGNNSFTVYLVNATDAEKPYAECSLAGIMVYKTDSVPLVLNNGISFSSSSDEVCEKYGLNKNDIIAEYAEGTKGFSISFYHPDDNGYHWDKGISRVLVGMNEINFNFDKPLADGGTLEAILVQYMTTDEDKERRPEEGNNPGQPDGKQDAGWICAACGTENHGKFCTECGAAKPEEKLSACPNCGWAIPEGTEPKFCSECGYSLKQ